MRTMRPRSSWRKIIDFLVTTVQIDKTYPVPVIRALGIMLDEAAANKALDEIIQQVHLVQEKK